MKQCVLAAALAAITLVLASPALAVGNACSVNGTTTTSIGSYDPFTGTTFVQVPVTLNLTRYSASGGKKTKAVDFYLTQPAQSPAGYDIRFQNSSVLYTLPATHTLSATSPPSGTIFYDFGGTAQADTVPLSLTVTIPPGVNLPAGQSISFDIVYVCTGSGGLNNVSIPTTLTQAITIQINVVSALQASYAGSSLDFGEIGSLTDTQAGTHTLNGAVRVASTGPYSVTLVSANGYKMTYSGGNLSTASQTIKYSAHFLGQTPDTTNPTFATMVCSPAGTGGQNLPISVTLREGGQTKSPSPSYRDTMTVTVTPLLVPYGGGTSACPGL